MKAKKRFGQNFLTNDTIIKQIVSLLNAGKEDLIIEIGPGRGALTKYLSTLESNLVCIEIDTDMHEYLDKYESNKCHIIYDDILNIDLNKIASSYDHKRLFVIGNLPYYITTPIIKHVTDSLKDITSLVFMVQKEVADRFCANEKSKDYGYMTLYLKYYYDVTKEIDVPKSNFNPIPKVDSAIVKFTSKSSHFLESPDDYFRFLQNSFRFKRKTLKNNLSTYDKNKLNDVYNKFDLKESIRPEEIDEELFIKIYKELSNK